jgi:GNAT superfamily N-acetyltransferase
MTSDVGVRAARPDEGERLREIAIAAKAYWGYDLAEVRRWADGGDFSPAGLNQKDVWVAEAAGRAIGWASLLPGVDPEVVVLDDLWVEPAWIGKGVGSLLFRRAAERARELGARRVEWEAEPNALGFYERLGGRYVRDSAPTVFGRVIPLMALDL